MNLLKLLHGFFKVILFLPTLCQTKRSWSLTKISNLVKLLLWIKGVEWVTVLNAFGPLYLWQCFFSICPSAMCKCARRTGLQKAGGACHSATVPSTPPVSDRRPPRLLNAIACEKRFFIFFFGSFYDFFILFITLWPLAVGHSCTIRSPVKKISK